MAMEYVNYLKAKAHISSAHKPEAPVLSEEDEMFLNRVIGDERPPPLPTRPGEQSFPVAGEARGSDAQIALMDGAQNIPLPETPNEFSEEPQAIEEWKATAASEKKRKQWSWLRRDSRDSRRNETATGLMEVAEGMKSAKEKPHESGTIEDEEVKREEEDMKNVLERLNLAAVNNRVFSISDETQQLLVQFNQVFKDLMNGVPTAYHDLESLLTNGDRELQKTFNHLPSFLQKLIEQLPSKMTEGFAPEILAAAQERASKSGFNKENVGKAAAAAASLGLKTPSLKDLVGKPGMVAGMMRSVITFLRARFPAFMGMNVLWSLALFVVLLVFWYCHKRGKEVRLEKERLLTEAEVARLEKEHASMDPNITPTTTAAPGAPMHEVEAGMREVQEAQQAVVNPNPTFTSDMPSSLSTTVQPAERASG